MPLLACRHIFTHIGLRSYFIPLRPTSRVICHHPSKSAGGWTGSTGRQHRGNPIAGDVCREKEWGLLNKLGCRCSHRLVPTSLPLQPALALLPL